MLRATVLTAILLTSAVPAVAHQGHAHHGAPACATLSLACATAVSAATTADGALWLAFAAGGQVAVSRSGDGGQHFAPAVTVSGPPARIDDGGEAKPSLLSTGDGRLLVTWAARVGKAKAPEIWLARSADNGAHWAPPARIAPSPAGQRFATLAAAGDGRLAALWMAKTAPTGRAETAALTLAWSEDGGAHWSAPRVIAAQACECCRPALAALPDNGLAAAWRQIFADGARDPAAGRLGADGITAQTRVAEDHWTVNACPHAGPALAVQPGGRWQVAWLTDGRSRQGLFHAFSSDDGHSFSPPRPLGDSTSQASQPALLVVGARVWLAWKQFDGNRTTIHAQASEDGGAHWSAPRELAATADSSDQAQLVAVAGRPLLSWLTRAEGWRLLPVEAAP